MKEEMLNEINSLYGDIMMAQDDIVYGRLHHKPDVEQQGLAKMEILMNATLQHLSYQMDYLKDVEFVQWIKVEDRLPKIGEEVLVAYKTKQCGDVGFRMGHRVQWRFATTDKNDFNLFIGEEMVTHWQEIVPPKED